MSEATAASDQLSLLVGKLDWSKWYDRLKDVNLSDKLAADVPLLNHATDAAQESINLSTLTTLLWQLIHDNKWVCKLANEILCDYPFATLLLWPPHPRFSAVIDPTSTFKKPIITKVCILHRLLHTGKWIRRDLVADIRDKVIDEHFGFEFTDDSVLRDCGLLRILAGLGLGEAFPACEVGSDVISPINRSMIRALSLTLPPTALEVLLHLPWTNIMERNASVMTDDILWNPPPSAGDWVYGAYVSFQLSASPLNLLKVAIKTGVHSPAKAMIRRDCETLKFRRANASKPTSNCSTDAGDFVSAPVIVAREKRVRESVAPEVAVKLPKRRAKVVKATASVTSMEVDDATPSQSDKPSMVVSEATKPTSPVKSLDMSQTSRLNALIAKQEEFRDRFLHLPVPKFDERSPCQVPELIECPYEHPRYGHVRVLAELLFVDDETPDPIKRRPNNYERYYWKRDENNQVEKNILARARVGYFHIIRAVYPVHSPLAVFIDEIFSSFNISAAALGNCDVGWKAWHLYDRPKYTMAHIASVNGFRNNLDLMRPFCPEDRCNDPDRTWMTVPRQNGDNTVRDSVLGTVQKLRLARNIAPLPTTHQPDPKPVYIWYIPYRDYFAAACRFECNEHTCSGGESDAARYRCPHGYEHEPYEVNENPDDVPLFDVPKRVVLVDLDDEDANSGAGGDETTSRKRSTKGTDSVAVANVKRSKRKLKLKYGDGLPDSKFDARIMFDRMDAHQLRSANHSDVQRILRAHLDELRSKPSRFPLGMRPIPWRMIFNEEEWEYMLREYTPAPNQVKVVANGLWRPVTFRLNRPAEVMNIYASQLETVTYQVLVKVVAAKITQEQALLNKCMQVMKI